MAGQRLWHPQRRSSFDRIGDLDILLIIEIVVEDPDTSQVTVDRLRHQPFTQEIIRILCHLTGIHCLNGHIHPQHKVLKDVQVVLDRVRGEVASFQEAPVVHDHIADSHPSDSFL